MSFLKKSQFVMLALALGIVSFGQTPDAFGKDKDASKKSAKADAGKKSSETPKAAEGGDEAAVRSLLDSVAKTLAAADATALTALWMTDGNYIGVDGSVCRGRDNLQKRFSGLMAREGRQEVELVPESIRLISPSVALAEGLVKRKNSAEGPMPEARFSMVLQKQDANWLISTVTETPLQASAGADPLNQLSWLVGEWSAEQKGGSVHMNAVWAPHKNFIVCTYEVKKSTDAPMLESKQIIGWDPRAEQPISWHFDSNGGYGFGSWVKKNKQWLVEASGVDRDGSTNSATNVIAPSDDNNFSWQSVNRSLNGLSFNDTEPLKVHRIK